MKPKPSLDLSLIPKEHREQLSSAGQALVRELEVHSIGWQRITVSFQCPFHTNKVIVHSIDVVLDDPGAGTKLTKAFFDPFLKELQRLWDTSGPEPWRTGEYEVKRISGLVKARGSFGK